MITQSIFPPADEIKGRKNFADLVENPTYTQIDKPLDTEDIGQIWVNKSTGLLSSVPGKRHFHSGTDTVCVWEGIRIEAIKNLY